MTAPEARSELKRCLQVDIVSITRASKLHSSDHDITVLEPLSLPVCGAGADAGAGAEAVTPACRLAAQLVAAWGELRQLEALLASLRATIAAGPAQPPLASVLRAPAFLANLTEVLAVTLLKGWTRPIKQQFLEAFLRCNSMQPGAALSGVRCTSSSFDPSGHRSWGRCRQGRHLRWCASWRRGCRHC